MTQDHSPRPARWAVVLAFALIYTSWGTTYLAIREGVHNQQLPPLIFGGTRVALAGIVLLAYLALRGEGLRFRWSEFQWVAATGLLLFVGGNGMITVAEKTVESGIASVLAATTPLWLAVLEMLWPQGERLALRGWFGLLLGLAGLVVLMSPTLQHPSELIRDPGQLLVLGSALAWAFGSLVSRYHRPKGQHLAAAAYQMLIGGAATTLLGLGLGEGSRLTAEHFTGRAWFAFFYLLIVGSLVGFVAFNWLLGHVSATLVGTYAYVNPIIAVLVGWLIAGEEITLRIVCGVAVILSGVALVRSGHVLKQPAVPELPPRLKRGLTGFWNLNAPASSVKEEK